MKISLTYRANRSKKGKEKLEAYLFHYLPNKKQKKIRLKGMFIYKRPRTSIEKVHNDNTKYEAEQILATARKEQRLGYYNLDDYTREPESVVAFCEEYIKTKRQEVKEGSISPYIKVTKLFREFFGECRTFADVKEEDAKKFKLNLLTGSMNRYKRNYKKHTVNTYLNRISLMFDAAMKAGNLTHKRLNVFREVGEWKVDKVKRPYISTKEYKLLNENLCVCKPIARAFKFSILTGLRTGDIMGLRWKDIQKDEKGWHLYITMQKTGDLIRVALTDEHFILMGERGHDNQVVFDYSMSNQEYTYFYTWIKATFGEKKEVGEHNSGIVFHSGRASFITNMLMRGIPAIRVQKYVGHVDLKTTLSYYRGSTEMQEEDMGAYIADIKGETGVLRAKQILSE